MAIDTVNLGRVDLNLLVHLDALLTERSVTRAAARVGIGQSAMSHNLARLRELLDDELLTRAADVTLKERRRLVLMVRETPLHTGHLRTMTALSEMGAIIAPPVPAFYAKPDSLDDMVDHTVGRTLDLFNIDVGVVNRWG